MNDEGVGGVPALFESFTEQAGLEYDVSLETRGGTGLDFHLAEKRDLIERRRWDIVVAHGYSTLDADQPRNPAKLAATAKELADVLRARNPRVALYLMATWARADEVYPDEGAWAGATVATMAADVRAAYDAAAAGAGATVIPVGDAWNRAMQAGVADANPYDGIDAGKLDLWTYDHYHASTHGYYLEALVIFGRLTGRDPRSLGASASVRRSSSGCRAPTRARCSRWHSTSWRLPTQWRTMRSLRPPKAILDAATRANVLAANMTRVSTPWYR